MKLKQLKHVRTFKLYPNVLPLGAYHKHRSTLMSIWYNTGEILTISLYKHKLTKEYFYRIHGKYWFTFAELNSKVKETVLITGNLRNLLAQYWKIANG